MLLSLLFLEITYLPVSLLLLLLLLMMLAVSLGGRVTKTRGRPQLLTRYILCKYFLDNRKIKEPMTRSFRRVYRGGAPEPLKEGITPS